jgi:hypothetical protein
MQEYILQVLVANKEALAALRLMPGLRVASDGTSLWVRGIPYTEQPAKEIWQMPVSRVLGLSDENYLFPIGNKVPVAKLPELIWIPLQQYIAVKPPVSAIKGETAKRVPVKIIPSSKVQAGEALLTTLADWKAYAQTAPATRLKQVVFAVSENNQVLLLGAPLPSLPGREYWKKTGMLIPCGYDFEIPVMADLLPSKLNLQNDSIVLFETDGSWQKIELNNFINAKRSSVRATHGTGT